MTSQLRPAGHANTSTVTDAQSNPVTSANDVMAVEPTCPAIRESATMTRKRLGKSCRG